ncbi:MAG: hypothetical protein C0507_07820, partial [Cyanobacteria bacterium PR.3.49]|nr:hypothetical protein [Cyanobacteria bacterium PR.3.49]
MGIRLKTKITATLLVLSFSTGSLCLPSYAQPSDAMRQAIELYSQGRLEEAAQLMQKDLRDNPENGIAHQYMGKILEKQGYDKQALQEFETAFRLIPQDVVDAGIKTAANVAGGKSSAPARAAAQKPGGNWFENMWNNVVDSTTKFFGGTPPPRTTSATTTTFDLNRDPTEQMPFWLPIAMPNLAQNIKKMWKESRKKVASLWNKHQSQNGPGGWHPYKS